MSLSTLPFQNHEVELPRWIGDYELPNLEQNGLPALLPNIAYPRKPQSDEQHLIAPLAVGVGKPVGETRERSWVHLWPALQHLEHRHAHIPSSSSWAPQAGETVRFRVAPLSRTYPMAGFYAEHDPRIHDLAASVHQSQDILIEMLKDRFERVVDALLRHRLGTRDDRLARLDALLELYEEGLLTKGEVRRRGNIEPENFYDELREYRLRIASP